MSTLSPDQIRRRKRLAADLGVASATIGLGTLGARGIQGALRLTKKPGAIKAAQHIANHTQSALIAGTGIGAAGALNSAAINRAEAKQRVTKKWKSSMTISAFGVDHADLSKGLTRDVTAGVSEGFKFAGAKPSIRATATNPRSPRKGLNLAHAVGEHAHDFGAGFSRKMPTKQALDEGTHTTRSNAVHRGTYTAGNLTRKVAVPTAVLGGGYATGHAFGSHREKKAMSKSYTPGTITYHHEQAQMHARKKTSGKRQIVGGLTAAGAGGTLYGSAGAVGHHYANFKTRHLVQGSPARYGAHAIESLQGARMARKGGLGLMAAGGAVAGVGAGRAVYHAQRQNAHTKAAQTARRQRNAAITKAYGYDPEQNRHRRAGLYSGASVVGGGVLGGVAAHQGSKAVSSGRKAASSFKAIGEAKGNGSASVMRAAHKTASVEGLKAVSHSGKAVGAAAGAGVLVAAGRKISQRQREGNWRSYNGY